MHSSNSVKECENMYIPVFLSLDKAIVEEVRRKSEDLGNLLENIGAAYSRSI